MSKRHLMILEVSQKQAYIFASNKLKDNVRNSAVISWITSPGYFKKVTEGKAEFSEADNIVYAGGGHTVLVFEEKEQARNFAMVVTKKIKEDFPGIEVFVKISEYDEGRNPGENLFELSKNLERKKSIRQAVFHHGSFGIEEVDVNTLEPELVYPVQSTEIPEEEKKIDKSLMPEGSYKPVSSFDELGVSENNSSFMAVVHIDGNAMGARIDNFRENHRTEDWNTYKSNLRRFSEAIDKDFKAAYKGMADRIAENLENGNLKDLSLKDNHFPVRRIITAGDDICYVTEGRIGLESAAIFLEELNKRTNELDGLGYSACAGVTLVHHKYPFYLAYELAEKLCSNAKAFLATTNAGDPGRQSADQKAAGSSQQKMASAIDWHIDFGETQDSLDEIREKYIAFDGKKLELRPYIVVGDSELKEKEPIRNYYNFKKLMQRLQNDEISYARGKIKEFRSILKEGEKASEYYLKSKLIDTIGRDEFYGVFKDVEFEKTRIGSNEILERKIFCKTADGIERSLFFDAIELIDTYIGLEY